MNNSSDSTIDGHTKLYGVIGDPIAQVRGPQLINPVFRDLGARVLAIPLHLPAEDLRQAWDGLRRIRNLAGLGVTAPHKIAVVELCDVLDPAAKMVGAVNCIKREDDGTMRGTVFDGIGFVKGLRAQGHDLTSRSVMVLGAGGAATAIAFAVADAGAAKLSIVNRTRDRAEALARRLRDSGFDGDVSADDANPKGHDVLINATSVGLRPEDPLLIDPSALQPGMLVSDIILKPEITPLLSVAKERGCTVHPGRHMLEGQVNLVAQYIAGET